MIILQKKQEPEKNIRKLYVLSNTAPRHRLGGRIICLLLYVVKIINCITEDEYSVQRQMQPFCHQ